MGVFSGGLPRDAGAALTTKIKFKGVERYRTDPRFRRAVLERVYNALPRDGKALLIAHSLGSVVALDLLNFLPPDLQIELLVTLGSPVGRKPVRSFLMGDGFPWQYEQVTGWLNLFDRADFITGGNGLEEVEGYKDLVVDVQVDNGGGNSHSGHRYLANAICARALGPLVATPKPVDDRYLTDAEAGAALIGMYSRRLAAETPFGDSRRKTMRKAIEVNEIVTGGALTAQGMRSDIRVDASTLGKRLDDEARLATLVELFFANPFSPFDIKVEKPWQREALRFLGTDLGGSDEWIDGIDNLATLAAKAHEERPWGKVLVGAGLVAAAIALPVIAVGAAAGVGLAGAAAMTSGLAALGGAAGMTGGLWVVGLASAAVGGGGAALLTNLTQEQLESELTKLQVVAVLEHRHGVGDTGSSETDALRKLAEQASEWIARHTKIDGKGHRSTRDWVARQDALHRAIAWIEDQIDE